MEFLLHSPPRYPKMSSMKLIGFRAHPDEIARVQRLVRPLSRAGHNSPYKVKLSTIYRLALSEGLAVLERRYINKRSK